jgi:hypothetical protein
MPEPMHDPSPQGAEPQGAQWPQPAPPHADPQRQQAQQTFGAQPPPPIEQWAAPPAPHAAPQEPSQEFGSQPQPWVAPPPGPHGPEARPPAAAGGWRERGAALLDRGRAAAAGGAQNLQGAAAKAAGAAREGWQQRDAIPDRARRWAGTGASAADAVFSRAAEHSSAVAARGAQVVDSAAAHSTAAWERSQEAYRAASSVPVDAQGRPQRPWEVRTAAILGLIAPLFVVAAIIMMATTSGRTLRMLGYLLRSAGSAAEAEALATAGEVSSGLAQVILGVGITMGVLVIAAFALYAWRVSAGRGRARWVALAALVLAFFLVTPLSPILMTCFLLLGTASVVCAFLPRASAWFARHRTLGGAQAGRHPEAHPAQGPPAPGR